MSPRFAYIYMVMVLVCLSLFVTANLSFTGMAAHRDYPQFSVPHQGYTLGSSSILFSSVSDTDTISINADDNAVYKYGYVSYSGSSWESVELSGDSLGGDWLSGGVSAQLSLKASDFGLSEPGASAERNFVVVYSCSRASNAWDCHGGWQILRFDAGIEEQPYCSTAIVDVWASSSENAENVPSKTLDGIFTDESRWAANGNDEWIAYELNATSTVNYLRLAFHADSIRYFDIQYSTDNVTWLNTSANGMESEPGMPNQYQTFTFEPVTADYIRVLGHGSDVSMWNSITETDINGFDVNLSEGDGGPACESHASMRCYGGDVYYYDSCGNREDVYDECTSGETCSGGVCVRGENLTYDPANYNIFFSNDFEDNSLGAYISHPGEWEDDWNMEWDWFKNNNIVSIVQHDVTKAMRFIFPEGTVNGVDQGTKFKVYVPGDDVHEELYLSYNIMFRPGFDFVISGKIPSLGGGEDWDDHPGAPYYDEGYRAGIAWYKARWNGKGFLRFYFYHHDQESPYGETLDWHNPDNPEEPYYIDTSSEKWLSITLRVVMNSLNGPGENGSNDGLAEAYVDGKLAGRWEGLRFRNLDSAGVDYFRVYSQFGGIGDEFATTRDEWMLTDDYYIWTYSDEYLAGHPEAPRGRQPSPAGRTIIVPGMKVSA